MLNNITHAYDSNPPEQNSSEKIKPEIFLGTLNTIVITANAFASAAETAPDVSPACETRVGTGPIDSLNSRTSFCLKFENEFDLYDAQAQGAYVNTVKIIGYAYAEDNPTNALNWPVKFRFRSVYTNPVGPFAQISPFLGCGTSPQGVDCTTTSTSPVILNPGLSQEAIVNTDLNMYSDNEKEISLVIEGKLNLMGQSVDGPGSQALSNGNIPLLRCDKGVVRTGSNGCVFINAPAVLTRINISNPDVDESAFHIRDAQFSGLPGKYISEQDSIQPNSDSKPLTRLRDFTARSENRKESLKQCVAKFNTYSPTCAPSGDPEDPEVDCDCDEYPFAATDEGAMNPNYQVSVRKIDPSDNRRAGAYLGVFFTQQRVKDGEKFYINVE